MKKLLVLLLFLAFGLACVAHAQPEPQPLPHPDEAPIRFEHLTNEDGLSQVSVYAIAQDRRGFMWFGTQEGLNRYDGYEFKVYLYDPDDPNSLGPGFIRSLLEDSHGNLWIGTNRGLNRLDPLTGMITHFYSEEGEGATFIITLPVG